MKSTKKYRVAYEFHGGGNIIVESTSGAKAGEQAREILETLVPKLRPSAAKVYKSQVTIIPNDSLETTTRDIFQKGNGDYSEPFDGTTPTRVS